MRYDVDRYARIVRSAAVDLPYWRGVAADVSASQRATTFTAVRWPRLGNGTAMHTADASGVQTAAAWPACVDVTGDIWTEILFVPRVEATNPARPEQWILGQSTTVVVNGLLHNGGFSIAWDSLNTVVVLALYDLAGATARAISSPAGVVLNVPYHYIHQSRAGGTGGRIWQWGIPVPANLIGAGAAENIAANCPIFSGQAYCQTEIAIARCGQGILDNDDAFALAGAAQEWLRC